MTSPAMCPAAVKMVRVMLPALPAVLAGLLLVVCLLPVSSASASGKVSGATYVALGDSYSAGEGLGSYQTGTAVSSGPYKNTCHRSKSRAYAELADIVLPQVHDRAYWACSGATVQAMENVPGQDGTPAQYRQIEQVAAVGPTTQYMTVTVGGDDLGFARIGFACAEGELLVVIIRLASTSCSQEVEKSEKGIPGLVKSLAGLYSELLAASSPSSELVVPGYPRVLPTSYTGLGKLHGSPFCTFDHLHGVGTVGMTVADAQIVAGFEEALNGAIQEAVNEVKSTYPGRIMYSDLYPVSVPRNCKGTTPNATVTGLEISPRRTGFGPGHLFSTATFHPTAAGQEVYARAVERTFKQLSLVRSTSSPGRRGGAWRLVAHSGIGTEPLSSLSCPSATFCVAVKSSGPVLRWDGGRWSALPQTRRLPLPGTTFVDAVSCGSTRSCMLYGVTTAPAGTADGNAVSSYTSWVEPWSPRGWGTPTELDRFASMEDLGVIQSLSCPTVTFCLAVGGHFGSAVYNGRSWVRHSAETTGTDGGASVVCTSSSFCMDAPAAPESLVWDGKTWLTPQTLPTGLGGDWLDSLACTSSSFCTGFVAGNAIRWNGRSWTKSSSSNATGGGDTLSCSSARLCLAGDSGAGGYSVFNGRQWSVTSVAPTAGLVVACARSSICLGIGPSSTWRWVPGAASVSFAPPTTGPKWTLIFYQGFSSGTSQGFVNAIALSIPPGASAIASLSVGYACSVWMLVPGTTSRWELANVSQLASYLNSHGSFSKDPVDDRFYVEGPESGATMIVQAPGTAPAPMALWSRQ